ncbi:MAG: 6-pyruvoyl-tetrahydropterin synthase-related protein, partial [Chloroflexota bacterium]|nr:6-pyruvoyl-tetrahydropterin synthase-related protein [Chloroflexota bacterium]
MSAPPSPFARRRPAGRSAARSSTSLLDVLRAAAPAWLRLRLAVARRPWLTGLLVALVVTTPAWLPWLDPRQYLWGVDDAKNHMIRIYHLFWLIERGVWHPRWMPDMYMGYGYPVLNFYAPIFYYLAWGLGSLLRLSVWDAYRATGVVAAIAGASGVYALTVALWRRTSLGVLAAVVLLYGPYVFQLNIFKRGDIPEALALALIPWLLLVILRLWLAPTWGAAVTWTVASAAVGAAVVLTHNLTALLAAVVALVWVVYLFAVRPAWQALARASLAGLVALGLTTFFWLPAIGEGRVVQLEELLISGGLDYRGWFIEPNGRSPRQQSEYNRATRSGLVDVNLHYPHQLVAPPMISWSQAGLGVLAITTGAGSLLAALGRHRRSTDATTGVGVVPGATIPLVSVAIACWYLTFAQSAWVWERIPGLPLLQFPWRLLGPLGICLAVAGAGALAGALALLERRWGEQGHRLGLGLVVAVTAVSLFNHVGDREFQLKPEPDRDVNGRSVHADEYKDLQGVGTTSNREFLPREVYIATYTIGNPRGRNVYERLYPEPEWQGGLFFPFGSDVRILGWRATPLRIGFRVANSAPHPVAVGVRQLRFPGWRAWIDGRAVPIGVVPYVPEQQASLGFMVVDIPPGEHSVSVVFGPSRLRFLALSITLVTWLTATGVLVRMLGRRRHWTARQSRLMWALLAIVPLYATWRGVWPAYGPLAFSPVPAAKAEAGVWGAPDLRHGEATLLVNVAQAVASGQGWINAPSGGAVGPESHVDVRHLTVTDEDPDRGAPGTSSRQWLYLHPPSSVSLDVALPQGRTVWFQSSLTLDPSMWKVEAGDGVRFLVTVTPLNRPAGGGESITVLDQTVNPRARQEQRRWVPVEADLSRWAGD